MCEIIKKLPKCVALYVFKFVYIGIDKNLSDDIYDIYEYNRLIQQLETNELYVFANEIRKSHYYKMFSNMEYGFERFVQDIVERKRTKFMERYGWNIHVYRKMYQTCMMDTFYLVTKQNNSMYLRKELCGIDIGERKRIFEKIKRYIDPNRLV